MRTLSEIGFEIARKWPRPYFGAIPYLRALCDGMYGHDSAQSIVLHFLSNARTWRGEDARRLKNELKKRLLDLRVTT